MPDSEDSAVASESAVTVTPAVTPDLTPTPEPEETPAAQILEVQADADTYKYVDIADGYYVITSALSGKALDIKGSSRANHANVQIYNPNNTAAQIFKISGKKETVSVKKSRTVSGKTETYTVNVTRKVYTISSYNASDKSLHVADSKNADNTNVKIFSLKGVNAQKWYITQESDGNYAIRSAVSGKTLSRGLAVQNNGKTNGTNVCITTIVPEAGQEWKFKKVLPFEPTGGMFTITLSSSGKVMDVAGGSAKSGANLQVYKANGTPAQTYLLKKVGYGGLYTITNIANRNNIHVLHRSTAAGTNVQMYKQVQNETAQMFRFESTGNKVNGHTEFRIYSAAGALIGTSGSNVEVTSEDTGWYLSAVKDSEAAASFSSGFYRIVPVADTNMAVDIAGASMDDGAKAQLYKYNGSGAQIFNLQTTSDGYVKFMNLNSGAVLSVANGSKKNGTLVRQWTNNDTYAVKWKIVPTGDGDGSVYLRFYDTNYALHMPTARPTSGRQLNIYSLNYKSTEKFYLISTPVKTGWQNYFGLQRYVTDDRGNYAKNTTIDGKKLGSDGLETNAWVKVNGYWRYRVAGKFVTDARPYLKTLYRMKSINGQQAPDVPGYHITINLSKCWATVFTKYPGTSSWNLPVFAFKVSPGRGENQTDSGNRYIVAHKRWSELMGPTYAQYTSRLSLAGSHSWSGELFHSIPCSSANNHNVPRSMYNALGSKQSHGCVRCGVRNAYWLYTFVSIGTSVQVGSGAAAPITPVKQPKMRSGSVDPTDPAYTGNYGYTDTNNYYGDWY